ncbi:MAG: carbon starvation CstA family protein [Pseudomonadota bacterium]
MIVTVVLFSIVVLGAGYLVYGRFLAGQLKLDNSAPTPACEINDGVDYVPAKASLLLGQHFSAIAAAGPIVGPILAGIWFGWAPALLWILLGTIFVGGVHDFTSLVASVRHRAASIGELVGKYMSRTSKALFLVFVWFALIYVIIAFTDITAQTFKAVTADTAFGPGVAASSFLYLLLGLSLGVALHRFRLNFKIATAVSVPLVIVIIWAGTMLPDSISSSMLNIPVKWWHLILLAYCFAASLIPMWLLLQPRGYLGGWFLYLTMAVMLAGTFFGGSEVRYPAFNLDGLKGLDGGKLLFPVLFITVACGACSGFHGIVSSGTTARQIEKEGDTKTVGYGSMILEGVVAVLALTTVMVIPRGDLALKGDPNFIYARGMAGYLNMAGVDFNLGLSFALLAFSTFVYDTLDVSTRLARYILQELFDWKSRKGAFLATFITLLIPLAFLMASGEKAYLAAWPIFGTSNQLLASLILLAVSVWLMKTGKKAFYTIIPMVFMLIVTLWSLTLQILPLVKAAAGLFPDGLKADILVAGIGGVLLLILSIWLIIEAFSVVVAARKGCKPA